MCRLLDFSETYICLFTDCFLIWQYVGYFNIAYTLSTKFCCMNERTDHFTPHFECLAFDWLHLAIKKHWHLTQSQNLIGWHVTFSSLNEENQVHMVIYVWIFHSNYYLKSCSCLKSLFCQIFMSHLKGLQKTVNMNLGFEWMCQLGIAQSECSWELLSIFYSRVKTCEMLPSTKFSLPACSERNEGFQVFPHFVRLPESFHTVPFNHSIIKPLRKSHAKVSSSLSVAVCINLFLYTGKTA